MFERIKRIGQKIKDTAVRIGHKVADVGSAVARVGGKILHGVQIGAKAVGKYGAMVGGGIATLPIPGARAVGGAIAGVSKLAPSVGRLAGIGSEALKKVGSISDAIRGGADRLQGGDVSMSNLRQISKDVGASSKGIGEAFKEAKSVGRNIQRSKKS